MLKDASECTIFRNLEYITDCYIPSIKNPRFNSAFDALFPQVKLEAISSQLRGVLRSVGRRRRTIPGDKVAEKDLMNAWSEVNTDYGPLCPGYSLHLSKNVHDSEDDIKSEISAGFIPMSDNESAKDGNSNWSLERYSLVFKRGGIGQDPFDDRRDPNTEKRVQAKVYEELLARASCVFNHQHRTAHFMFFVNGGEFRFMRWDRSGVIVSEATDYVKSYRHTKVLLRLLYGLSKLTAAEAGLDWSATRLSPDSCGYKQMHAHSSSHAHDLDENQFEVEVPSQIQQDFNISAGSAPTSSLFEKGELFEDPCATRCRHSHSHPPIPTFNYIREDFRRSLDPRHPLYLLKVSGHDYVVGKPNFSASRLIGRGTRGYIALHWKTQRFVYLKDTWRQNYVGLGKEAEVLAELNAAGVENVPTLIHHEDIKGQETETSRYAPKGYPMDEEEAHAASASIGVPSLPTPTTVIALSSEVSNGSLHSTSTPTPPPRLVSRKCSRGQEEECAEGLGLRHYIHHRMTVAEVCLPFLSFKSGLDLVLAIFNAFVAHRDAVDKCRLIHRDVSSGNILNHFRIVSDEERTAIVAFGVLTDWELAKRIRKDGETESQEQSERMGTWQFMPVTCLLQKDKVVDVADEIESFLNVLIYGAILRVQHNLDQSEVDAFVRQYFDGTRGLMKQLIITCAILELAGKTIIFYTNARKDRLHPLNGVIHSLLRACQSRLVCWTWARTLHTPYSMPPTPEQQRVADRMLTHDFTRDLLSQCLWGDSDSSGPRWPPDGSDLDEDRL